MRRHIVSSHFFYNSPRLLCVLRLRLLAMRFAPAFACYAFWPAPLAIIFPEYKARGLFLLECKPFQLLVAEWGRVYGIDIQ